MNKAQMFFQRHSTAIATAAGVVGLGVTIALTVRTTLKVKDFVDHDFMPVGDDKYEYTRDVLTGDYPKELRVEAVKRTVRCLAPSAIFPIATSLSTVFAFTLANRSERLKREAAEQAFYLVEDATGRLMNKTIETFGEGRARKLIDGIAQDKVNENPIEDAEDVYDTGNGDLLVLDAPSGRYFRSSHDAIRKAENQILKDLALGPCVLNDLYRYLNIPEISLGKYVGWMTLDEVPMIEYTSALTASNDPVLVLDYWFQPNTSLIY